MTVAEIVAKLTPEQRVAMTLWGEARGSSPQLRAGIASAIGNRVKARRKAWGLTADAVCLKPWQFSCWRPEGGRVNHLLVLEQARRLISGLPAPPVLASCLELAAQLCADAHPDTVARATHYYEPRAMVPPGRIPDWAKGLSPVAVIGSTRFYAGVK